MASSQFGRQAHQTKPARYMMCKQKGNWNVAFQSHSGLLRAMGTRWWLSLFTQRWEARSGPKPGGREDKVQKTPRGQHQGDLRGASGSLMMLCPIQEVQKLKLQTANDRTAASQWSPRGPENIRFLHLSLLLKQSDATFGGKKSKVKPRGGVSVEGLSFALRSDQTYLFPYSIFWRWGR